MNDPHYWLHLTGVVAGALVASWCGGHLYGTHHWNTTNTALNLKKMETRP